MNLHQIASGAISSVNPFVAVTGQVSTGTYTTAGDGTRTPAYTTINTTGQIQPLSTQDLKKLNALNIQNVTQKGYLNGNYEGVFRALGKGGDLLTFGGETYLVTAVLERWPDWCCVGLTMQV